MNAGCFKQSATRIFLCHSVAQQNLGSHIFFMTQPNQVVPDFNDLGIADNLLAVLAQQKYTLPTPIQRQCIPLVLDGHDVVGIAQTGTGKTLACWRTNVTAFIHSKGQGLIVLPTRELALQVDEVLQKLGGKLGLRTVVVIGGASMEKQTRDLRRNRICDCHPRPAD